MEAVKRSEWKPILFLCSFCRILLALVSSSRSDFKQMSLCRHDESYQASGIKGTDSSYNETPLSFSSLHQCFQFGAFLCTPLAVLPPPLFTEFSLSSPLCIPKLWDSTVSIRTFNSVVRTYIQYFSFMSRFKHLLWLFSHCSDFTLFFTLAAWINPQMEKKINNTLIIDCLFGSVGISCPPAGRSGCGASRGLNMIKPFRCDSEPQSQELPTP